MITFSISALAALTTLARGPEQRRHGYDVMQKVTTDIRDSILTHLGPPLSAGTKRNGPKWAGQTNSAWARVSLGGVNLRVATSKEKDQFGLKVEFWLRRIKGEDWFFEAIPDGLSAITNFLENDPKNRRSEHKNNERGKTANDLDSALIIHTQTIILSDSVSTSDTRTITIADALLKEIADAHRELVLACALQYLNHHQHQARALQAAIPDDSRTAAAHSAHGPGRILERREVVEALIAATRARPLVLLAGVSGSGKTELAVRIGQARAAGLLRSSPSDKTVRDLVDGLLDHQKTPGSFISKAATEPNWLVVEPLGDDIFRASAHANGTTPLLDSSDEDEEDEDEYDAESGEGDSEDTSGADEGASTDAVDDKVDVSSEQPLQSFGLAPVRPDWHEAASLWGWLRDKVFYGTPALRLVLDAWRTWVNSGTSDSLRKPVRHVLILDEMNLSRLEYYGSDLLSAMEQPGKALIHLHDAGEQVFLASEPSVEVPPSIGWPPGLCVIGTVNVDETTFSFAPKVLDRACVLEFIEVNLKLVFEVWNWQPIWTKLSPWFDAIQNALQPYTLHLGYRAAREIVLLLQEHLGPDAATWKDEDIRAQLDLQLRNKVLPRVRGPRGQAEPVLLDLLALAIVGPDRQKCIDKRLELRKLVEEGFGEKVRDAASTKESHYPRAARKAADMLLKLDGTGFTGFF
ncbi:hypothetical protein [Sorangium sp. So ce385]|uniref:hypothetical protein n=1 Tax=Sorangium sp. So ce385 TaxID=3133308 RepID=UPI003F5AFA06